MKRQTIPLQVEGLSYLQGISLLGQSHLGKLELNFGLLCDIKVRYIALAPRGIINLK
jgi:hypothetical protein